MIPKFPSDSSNTLLSDAVMKGKQKSENRVFELLRAVDGGSGGGGGREEEAPYSTLPPAKLALLVKVLVHINLSSSQFIHYFLCLTHGQVVKVILLVLLSYCIIVTI